MTTSRPAGRSSRWPLLAVLGLFLLLWWRLLDTAAYTSPTMDEVLHVFHGVVYWRVPPTATLHNITNNPPLVNALIGLTTNLITWPSLTIPPAALEYADYPGYVSQVFMWEINPHGLAIIWAGRLAIIYLTLLLAALLYRWSRLLWFHPGSALLVLFLYVFDPNILANGGLATLDLGTALFMLLAAFAIWRYYQRPNRLLYFLAGLALGCALATKFSAIVMIPAIGLIAFYRAWQFRTPRLVLRELFLLGGWLLLAAAIFIAIYRFDVTMFTQDFLWQQSHQLTGHPAFLLGEVSEQGWWYYFPLVFAIKTPLPTLLLVITAVILFLIRRPYPWQGIWLLLVPAGVMAASMLTHVNIGYRYLLPLLPFLFVFTGAANSDISFRPGYAWVRAILVGWLALSSLLIHPHYLAYFNELAGGPEHGWQIVVDSNVDWGQDLGALGDYLSQRGIDEVQGAWLSVTPPEQYGFRLGSLYEPFPEPDESDLYVRFYPHRPVPGTYVFSATFLQGVLEKPPTSLHWFRQRPADDRVGYSLFVYDVQPDGPAIGLALAGIGLGSLPPADFDRAFASNNVTLRWYDPRSAFLWPGGKQEQPWAAIGEDHYPTNPALQAFYPSDSLVLRSQGRNSEGILLNYLLFRWDSSPIQARLNSESGQLYSSWGWSPEPTLPPSLWQDRRQTLPGAAVFGNTLELLSYEQLANETPFQPSGQIEWLTYWRVHQRPPAQLKIFLHLLDEQGNLIAQQDGLDILTSSLQPGDEFAQYHLLTLPAQLPAGLYGWQLGVYDEESGARLTLVDGTVEADRLLLHTWIQP